LQGAFAGQISHLWSLAVEEQFYLLWPAVILLIPQRFLTHALVTGILTGVVFRLLIITDTNEMGRLLMPSSLDSFCIGGLLAYGRAKEAGWYTQYIKRQSLYVLGAFVLLFIVHLPFFKDLPPFFKQCIYLFFISVAFGIIIDRVTYSVETPILKQVLNNKLLLYIGKISYGIYLFHNFIPYFFELKISWIPDDLVMYIVQILRFIVLLLISTASWYLIEQPILKIKNRFPTN
jgi:peptidoglycan/LPS O-acetylase OafA/YrhL